MSGREKKQMPLTLPEAAEVAGIAPRNMLRWITSGTVRATKDDKGRWAIAPEDLLDAIARTKWRRRNPPK